MNDLRHNFLIHHGEGHDINCGFDIWCISDDTATYPVFTGKNGFIAFREIRIDEDNDLAYDRELTDEIRILEDIRRELNDDRQSFAMTVVKTSRKTVELLPENGKYSRYRYLIVEDQYNDSFEWYPLEIGDKIEAKISRIEKNLCFCSVKGIIDRKNKSGILVTIGAKKDRLSLDLKCMSDRVLIQANAVDLEEITHKGFTYKNLQMSLNNILLGGKHNISLNHEHIIGKDTTKGSEYMMWVSKPQDTNGKRKYYSLSFSESFRFDSSMDVDKPSGGTSISVIGTVYKIQSKDACILVTCETPKIASRVYESRLSDPAKWWKYLKDYLPLGFPARFNLDVETKTKKHCVVPRGFNVTGKLKGRISNDTDAQDLSNRTLKKHVYVTPHRLKEAEQAMLVNSPDYAGWAYFDESPKALINYAKTRIFSTEMKVPSNLRIADKTVRFNIKEALQDELTRLNGLIGKSEEMRICSIFLGKVYLTTKGGYPVEYTCHDLKEEDFIRQNMFMTMDFIIESIEDDWVGVNTVDWFHEQIENLGIQIGGYFMAKNISIDKHDRWHTTVNRDVDCIVVSETLKDKELLRENDKLMLVGYNLKARHLIAVAHPERLTDTGGKRIRVNAITDITNELWLCTCNGNMLLMHSSEKQSSVLCHLKRLYGDETYVDVIPETQDAVAGCRFNGVACGFDYSPLFTGKAINLPLPVSEQTPRVLFGDIILTATEDEIRKGPMKRVLPAGIADIDGTMPCSRTAAEESGNRRTSSSGQDICKGTVTGTDAESVVFDVDGKKVAIPDEMLHMDALDHDDICSVFSIGSEWALRQNGDAYEVSTTCPKRISTYTLIRQTGSRNRGRGRHDITWIVKHECGAIAETVIEDNGQKPNDRILLHSEDDQTDEIMNVIEPDYIGVKIPLILDAVEDDRILCHRADGITLCNEYVIPKKYWSWYTADRPVPDLDLLKGCAFMARVLDYDSECATLDRRCLLRQNELLPDSTEDGIYQMAVDGSGKHGVILKQNGVKVNLPWDEVSLCEMPNDDHIRKEFFRKGTLINVALTYDHTQGKYEAKWRTELKKDKVAEWKKDIRSRKSFAGTVHHIGLNALYMDIDGIPMYITSAQLGLWEGDVLENHFEEGQYLTCGMECSNNGLFTVSIDNSNEDTDIPIIYSVHEATLVRYISDDNLDCVVKFGKWFAIVREDDLTWEPVAEGEKPYECGARIKIRIEEIDRANKKMTASVTNATPKPETGPASEKWKDHPELRWFTYDTVNEKGHIWVKDKEGKPGIMFKGGDYTCTTESLINKMKKEGGCWLVLKGVGSHFNRVYYHCSHLQASATFGLECALKNTPAGEKLIKKVTIRKVSQGCLLISHGIALGTMSAKECTGQNGVDLTQYFKAGDEMECAILNIVNMMFTASRVQAHPNGFADILGNITVGSTVLVTPCQVDDKGVYVHINNTFLQGRIPCEEVPESDHVRNHNNWAERFKGDFVKVKCIDINYKTRQILFSRRQFLGEGVEE